MIVPAVRRQAPSRVHSSRTRGNGGALGVLTEPQLTEVRRFGALADRKESVIEIDTGGFIAGLGSSAQLARREEEYTDVEEGTKGSEEGRPAAGSWQGRSASRTSGSPTQTLVRRVSDLLRFEELVGYYPGTGFHHRSSDFVLVTVPVGPFRSLPHRAHLYLEVPLDGPASLPPLRPYEAALRRDSVPVPDLRAWAMWDDGVVARAFHEYPDYSLCAYMPWDWIWGRDPLHSLADWCVLWLAKAVHLMTFDRWPGPQHCPANIRVLRNKPDEFCGCEEQPERRWRDCHMKEDLGRTGYDLFMEGWRGRAGYLWELGRRGWDPRPPWAR